MKEVQFQGILKAAQDCYREKSKWHFHILTPECQFNKNEKFSIIFESSKTNLVSHFDQKPLKEGEQLDAQALSLLEPIESSRHVVCGRV